MVIAWAELASSVAAPTRVAAQSMSTRNRLEVFRLMDSIDSPRGSSIGDLGVGPARFDEDAGDRAIELQHGPRRLVDFLRGHLAHPFVPGENVLDRPTGGQSRAEQVCQTELAVERIDRVGEQAVLGAADF